jgi:hypothetical protein
MRDVLADRIIREAQKTYDPDELLTAEELEETTAGLGEALARAFEVLALEIRSWSGTPDEKRIGFHTLIRLADQIEGLV